MSFTLAERNAATPNHCNIRQQLELGIQFTKFL